MCACVSGREWGERVSWGFVYDSVRCSFDALFSPNLSSSLFDSTNHTRAKTWGLLFIVSHKSTALI